MKDRIKLIMESENLNPARFADTLNIGRAVISHILNGRNNPSLDVITRILSKMPQINSDWLLTGTGSMYKELKTSNKENLLPDLFSTNTNNLHEDESNSNKSNTDSKNSNLEKMNPLNTNYQESVEETVSNVIIKEKKIKQIIIYYTDNTFETFNS